VRSRATAAVLSATVLLGGAAVFTEAAPGPAAVEQATPKKPKPLKPELRLKGATIYAAASLAEMFPAMAPKETYSFAGSDQLAFQIEQGAPADVFASANVRYPNQLFAKGLVEQPVVFAYNVLVVIVPKANPARIDSVDDIAKPGVKLVIGDATVPVGSYTRTVLKKLNLEAALNNVVSNESDVRGVVTKVALGEADAGVAYWTDFLNERKRVKYVAIPESAQPTVAYSIAVNKAAPHPAQARSFVRYLRGTVGKRWLKKYGFRLEN